jgi:branched-chain amino acid transport system permease protein
MKPMKFGFVLGTTLLLLLPLVLSQSLLNAAIQMLIAALFACAFNLLCGQGGMLSFGHAAYFGVGAFATLHAMKAMGGVGLLPTPLLPLAGAVAGLAFGMIAGWFATKRSGTYFAMITLALAELLHALAPHLKSLFGGESGVSAMRTPAWGMSFGNSTQLYYLTLIWVLASLGLLYLFTHTPVGRLTVGLRENSHRLRFLGYDVHRLSVLVFSVSAMFSGIAGGLQAVSNESANYVVFESHLSAVVVLNTYIGGVSVFLGPALGAALMTFFGYAVSDLSRSWLLYQGVLFVLVMMFLPTGLIGLISWWNNSKAQYGFVRLLPVAILWLFAVLLLTVSSVFLVELLQRMFSLDYRALASVNPVAPWPAITLFARPWFPGVATTWLPPILIFFTGCWAVRLARSRWQALLDNADVDASLSETAGDGVKS